MKQNYQELLNCRNKDEDLSSTYGELSQYLVERNNKDEVSIVMSKTRSYLVDGGLRSLLRLAMRSRCCYQTVACQLVQ